MRNTQARTAIIDFLASRTQPTSAKEIVDAVSCERPELNKSTVYRFINSLLEGGQLVMIQVPGRGAVYELRTKDAHYHFTCEECQAVICMGRESSNLKRLVPRGYTVSPEHLVLSGVCPNCQG